MDDINVEAFSEFVKAGEKYLKDNWWTAANDYGIGYWRDLNNIVLKFPNAVKVQWENDSDALHK